MNENFRLITEKAGYRDVVYSDAVRRADVWRRKGIDNRTICEGLVKAALEWSYQDEDICESLSLCRYVTEESEKHKTRIENLLLEEQDETL